LYKQEPQLATTSEKSTVVITDQKQTQISRLHDVIDSIHVMCQPVLSL